MIPPTESRMVREGDNRDSAAGQFEPVPTCWHLCRWRSPHQPASAALLLPSPIAAISLVLMPREGSPTEIFRSSDSAAWYRWCPVPPPHMRSGRGFTMGAARQQPQQWHFARGSCAIKFSGGVECWERASIGWETICIAGMAPARKCAGGGTAVNLETRL